MSFLSSQIPPVDCGSGSRLDWNLYAFWSKHTSLVPACLLNFTISRHFSMSGFIFPSGQRILECFTLMATVFPFTWEFRMADPSSLVLTSPSFPCHPDSSALPSFPFPVPSPQVRLSGSVLRIPTSFVPHGSVGFYMLLPRTASLCALPVMFLYFTMLRNFWSPTELKIQMKFIDLYPDIQNLQQNSQSQLSFFFFWPALAYF